MVHCLRSSVATPAMQIRLFLEYHQNTDICRDIVFRRSLGTRVRGATGASLQRRHRELMGGTLGRGSRLPNNGHRRHGAEGSKHHRKRVGQSSVGGLRGKRFILPQKLFNLFAGDAGAKQVSLHFITFERPQKRGLLMGFHSLVDHLQM